MNKITETSIPTHICFDNLSTADGLPGTSVLCLIQDHLGFIWIGTLKGASIQLMILPLWWQAWWAYLVYGLLLSGAIWAFIQYRSQALLRENRILEEKVAWRTLEVEEQKEEIEVQRDQLEQTLAELQTTQAQLLQKEKLASLGELTAGVAHEIQNPLNFVNNFSEVSTELIGDLVEELDRGDTEEAKVIAGFVSRNLQKINHHGSRASSIVRDMLEHSRTSSGQKQATNLNALADEYLKIAYHGLRAKNNNFTCELVPDFDATLGKVELIPQDMGRVLLNLYNNAFYAVNQRQQQAGDYYQPAVAVSTCKTSSGVELRISDNGIGMSEEIKAKIFQPFFTTKPTGEGTGLGLSLSYDIVTKGHNGMLTVESIQEAGTTFTIHLPVDESGPVFLKSI